MPISKRIAQASKAAQGRIAKRTQQAEKASTEAKRAAIDPFIATLSEKFERDGEVRYEIPDGQWRLTGPSGKEKCIATGHAADIQAACKQFGLKTKVEYHSDTVEYRRYEWAILVIKP